MGSEHNAALNLYLAHIAGVPGLSREREAALAQGIRRGLDGARNELVEANLGFVVSMAKGYRNLGLPFEDLLHEGNLGLIEAAQRFDERRGVKFITYAMWWIRRSILLALKAQPGVVRLPDSRQRRQRRERDARDTLRHELHREPEFEEVGRRLGRRPSDEAPLDRAQRELGLDQPAGVRLLERLAAAEPTVEDQLIRQEWLTRLAAGLFLLSPRARRIVLRRFGLDGEGSRTLLEVSRSEGISRERARQVEREALERLRQLLQRRARPGTTVLRLVAAPQRSGVPTSCLSRPAPPARDTARPRRGASAPGPA